MDAKVRVCVLAIIVAKIERALEGRGAFIDWNFLMQTFLLKVERRFRPCLVFWAGCHKAFFFDRSCNFFFLLIRQKNSPTSSLFATA